MSRFKKVALVAGLTLTLAYCGGDQTTSPTTSPALSPVESAPAAQAVPPPPEAPTPEEDASGGKGVSATFAGLDATIVSTNTGHSNSGLVCYTNGFQGPNLPGTPVPWAVEAKSTVTIPFPKEKIEASLQWGEEQCEQTIGVQGDVFRGDACEGHILAVAWPQDNKVTFSRPEGAWVEGAPVYGEWSECRFATEEDLTNDPTCRPNECRKSRVVTYTSTKICTEDTKTRTEVEYAPCECPCQVVWKRSVVRENFSEWSECRAGKANSFGYTPPEWTECEGVMSRSFEEVVYETNSCTKEVREHSRTPKIEESPCGYKCLAGLTHTERKRYCGWLGCKSHWYLGSTVKWQCQSVPPGTPGHYDNHFGRNGHDDFFGEPNEDKCYNVTN